MYYVDMNRMLETEILAKFVEFMEKHEIYCAESVHQCDSINLDCVEFVSSLVELAEPYVREEDEEEMMTEYDQ